MLIALAVSLAQAEDNFDVLSFENLDEVFVNGFESFREERRLEETSIPSSVPSSVPSIDPTEAPSIAPTDTFAPSDAPTISSAPSESYIPSAGPSVSRKPSTVPSEAPSKLPSSSPSNIPSFSPMSKITLGDFSYLEVPPNGATVSHGDEVKFSFRYTPSESSDPFLIFLVCYAMKNPATFYEEDVDLYSELIYDDIPGTSPGQDFAAVEWPVYSNFFQETDTAQCGYAAFEGIDEDEARERLLRGPKRYVTDLGIRYEYEETSYEVFRLTSFRKRKNGTEFCIQPRLQDTTAPFKIVTKKCGEYRSNELFYFGDEGQIIAKREVDGSKICLTRGGTPTNGLLVATACPDPVEDTIPTEFLFFRGFNDVITNVDDHGDVRAITFGGRRKNNMIIYLKAINGDFPLTQKFRMDFDLN